MSKQVQEKALKLTSVNISRWVSMRFSILIVGVFIGMFMIWSIDVCCIRTGFNVWQKRRAMKLHVNPINLDIIHIHDNFTHYSPPPDTNLTQFAPLSMSNSNEVEQVLVSNLGSSSDAYESQVIVSHSIAPESPLSVLDWISVELEPNYTANLLSRWLAPGGEPCRYSQTVKISIPGLDEYDLVELPTGEVHEFVIQALDDAGNQRCLGGDYFEIDLAGESWKSRPPINDFGNGSYSLKFQVHPDFAGEYNMTIVLLFRHYEGLRFTTERFVYWKELRNVRIKFNKSSAQLPELPMCKGTDFGRDVWSGRWTRHGKNEKCEIDFDGRYRCLKPDFPCQLPWCSGSLGAIESNGWVYSSHCSFQIFSANVAWECLQNRWIFFWGDSNHVDSIRNLLNFVLGLPDIKSVPRRFDLHFTNPKNSSQTVRITSIFNGHSNDTKNYEGLDSLQNEEYRNLLKHYFSGKTVPDTMIMNSGLHDGVHWKNIRRFANGAEYATRFWKSVFESVKARGIQIPKLMYRTTIATGGYARSLAFNPNKMEVYNAVMLDKLRSAGILSGVIDNFDMTFPWHYDNRCNDGVHYGRAPAKLKWRDGEIGHQYFVDLMLGYGKECIGLLKRACGTKMGLNVENMIGGGGG